MELDRARNHIVEALTWNENRVGKVIVACHLNNAVAEKIVGLLPFQTELLDVVAVKDIGSLLIAHDVTHAIEVYCPDKAGYDKCKELRRMLWKHHAKVLSLFDWQEGYLDNAFWREPDYRALSRAVASFVEKIEQVDHFHITSSLGTNISFSTKGRRWIGADGMCRSVGTLAQMPDGEVFTCPVEDTFTGIVVVDGTVTRAWVPTLPQRLEFYKGKLVDCSPAFAEYIKDFPEEIKTIGEFAIGMNPGVHKSWGNISVDEKAAGTVHFALGDSYGLGHNKCECHVDFVVRHPVIYVEPELRIPFAGLAGK